MAWARLWAPVHPCGSNTHVCSPWVLILQRGVLPTGLFHSPGIRSAVGGGCERAAAGRVPRGVVLRNDAHKLQAPTCSLLDLAGQQNKGKSVNGMVDRRMPAVSSTSPRPPSYFLCTGRVAGCRGPVSSRQAVPTLFAPACWGHTGLACSLHCPMEKNEASGKGWDYLALK